MGIKGSWPPRSPHKTRHNLKLTTPLRQNKTSEFERLLRVGGERIHSPRSYSGSEDVDLLRTIIANSRKLTNCSTQENLPIVPLKNRFKADKLTLIGNLTYFVPIANCSVVLFLWLRNLTYSFIRDCRRQPITSFVFMSV